MKNWFWSLILALGLSLVMLVAPTLSSASGTTTTDDQSGQVLTTTNGDTRFLSTDTRLGGSLGASSSSAVDQIDEFFQLPKGFARSLGIWITGVTSLLVAILVLIVFAQLVMGGFFWITSGGDKGKTEQARSRIVAAIIGLLIVAASYAVLVILLRFLGYTSVSDAFNQITPLSSGSAVLR